MLLEKFIIFDLEYTWRDDNPDFYEKEIIQAAALKVDAGTLETKDSTTFFVKPTLNPIIPQCEIDFTGITQETVDSQGLSFPQAYEKFKNFVGNLPCFSHGWSRSASEIGDGEIWSRGLKFNNMTDANPPRYFNIAPWFREKYEFHNIKIEKQSSGQIARLLGREQNLKSLGLAEHNALYDCHSILQGIKFFGGFGFTVR